VSRWRHHHSLLAGVLLGLTLAHSLGLVLAVSAAGGFLGAACFAVGRVAWRRVRGWVWWRRRGRWLDTVPF